MYAECYNDIFYMTYIIFVHQVLTATSQSSITIYNVIHVYRINRKEMFRAWVA